jgi:transposase, IS6 family
LSIQFADELHAKAPFLTARRYTTIGMASSPTPDADAAKRFFVKTLHSTACSAPQVHLLEAQGGQPTAAPNTTRSAHRVINVDKNAAYPKAMTDLKAAGLLPHSVELRQVKYHNNLVE